jgi:hypothetical protein
MMRPINFSIYLKTFQPHHSPGVYSAYKINEYQKIFLEIERGRRVRLET